MLFRIKEITVNEDDITGVQAISFVDKPAIETDFEYFAQAPLLPYFKYVGPKDTKNRPFCAGKIGNVYHISEINSWQPSQDDAPTGTPFFANFTNQGGMDYQGNMSFRCDSSMFGCRHTLIRVAKKSDVPPSKRGFEPNIQFNEEHFVNIEMASEEKREVKGLVLKSGQMIFRNDTGDGSPGYVWFSRETIKKIKDKYGFNRSITWSHRDDITGQAILLDSWLEEDNNETRWFVKYKIIGDKLWELIKAQVVRGFSIEAIFKMD